MPTTTAPSEAPSSSPTLYPSPGCDGGAALFSARFLPDALSWTGVTSSVWSGSWETEKDDSNVLLRSLSDPYPQRDFLCVVTGCYTIEFTFDGTVTGLSFTIESTAEALEVSIEDEEESSDSSDGGDWD